MSDHFFSVEDALFDQWDPFVHPEAEALQATQTRSHSGKQAIDIEDCLNGFTKEELLDEDNWRYCPSVAYDSAKGKNFTDSSLDTRFAVSGLVTEVAVTVVHEMETMGDDEMLCRECGCEVID
ncbi:hypothetical protein FS749_009626 [Ceratobasidium sp. UAMH 11750]|nr:hypothetical protein FS749_009626 [Ceratobasidium sp. UAMH 11750]